MHYTDGTHMRGKRYRWVNVEGLFVSHCVKVGMYLKIRRWEFVRIRR